MSILILINGNRLHKMELFPLSKRKKQNIVITFKIKEIWEQ
jgi:hypothetical protein